MPDQLNKQSLVNLLIDSPLREPIKINLIDIVNNTSDVDLPKIYPTITKELEIFQKATERRMKLAEESIAKLGSSGPTPQPQADPPRADTPLPSTPSYSPPATPEPGLSAPKLDLPPLPTAPIPEPALPTPEPLGGTTPSNAQGGDEAALAEIQKELDSLKTTTADEITSAATPPAPSV